MAHRIFRFAISPEDAPDVRRVIDLDGRSSLGELHRAIALAYAPEVVDKLYAFFLSGRAWDKASAYLDPRADGARADKALLFRLGLREGQTLAYILDFKQERQYQVTVVSVREATSALPAPLLVESVGEAPIAGAPAAHAGDAAKVEQDPPELGQLVTLAEAFLDFDDELDPFAELLSDARLGFEPWEADDAALIGLDELRATPANPLADALLQEAVPLFGEAATAAEALLQELNGDVQRFLSLDEWLLERALGPRLLDLPVNLALVGETERAVSLAKRMLFIDEELMQGDVAVILARAGRREEALAQVSKNLDAARDASLVEAKAGDVYRALGEPASAEAYYRRSLVEAKTPSDRLHALLRLVSCLTDTGRDVEAAELLQQARKERGDPSSGASARTASVGRNDSCPCGSGKKFKKCHGQDS